MGRGAAAVLVLGLATALGVILLREGGAESKAIPDRPPPPERQPRRPPPSAAPVARLDTSKAVLEPVAEDAGAPLPQPQGWVRPTTPEQYWRNLEELRLDDRERALAYALMGEEWYPDTGKPAEARRAMIVTLLVELGRMPEARDRTRAFIQKYPHSPYRRLVQGLTGIHPRPGRPGGSEP